MQDSTVVYSIKTYAAASKDGFPYDLDVRRIPSKSWAFIITGWLSVRNLLDEHLCFAPKSVRSIPQAASNLQHCRRPSLPLEELGRHQSNDNI